MSSRFLLFCASAGSGKTFSLAVQYITLLVACGPREYASTLAVTFTNKATAEMKERILEQLCGIGQCRPESEKYLKAVRDELRNGYRLTLSDEEIRKRCREALTALLHDYSRFHVSTIDSFFQSVLRNMAHELGLTAHLQVDISDEAAVEMAVEHLVESLQEEDSELLDWLDDYIQQQLAEDRSWDIAAALTKMGRNLLREDYLCRVLDERNRPMNVAELKVFKQQLELETCERKNLLKQRVDHLETIMGDNGIDYEELKGGKVLRTFVEKLKSGNETDAEWKKTLDTFTDTTNSVDALVKFKNVSVALERVLLNIRRAVDELHQEFDRQLPALNTLQLLRNNLHPMGVLSAMNDQLMHQNADANRFSLAHTPILLAQMVNGSDAPFVYEKTGTRYRNVMIDEFQDTSRLQWQNFKVLLMNNVAGDGLSMVVGDVKQSIYRWRNGDWTILQNLKTKGLGHVPTTRRNLDTNFRSMGNIVQFNNAFFPQAARWLDSLNTQTSVPLGSLYDDVKQNWVEKQTGRGYVRLHIRRVIQENDDWPAITMQEMGEQMDRLHCDHKVPYNKMAILVRKKEHIALLINYFSKQFPHIRLVSSEAFQLNYSVAVGMLVDALRVIDNYGRRDVSPLPLYHLMQMYLREVTRHAGKDTDYLFLRPEEVLPRDFTNNLPVLRRMPLYTLCEHLYRTLHLERVGQQDAYLLCFFDELSAYLDTNPSDLASFLNYWDATLYKKNIPQSTVDGVSILTIHKSKGLQYHTVLVPFMDFAFERDRTDETMWCHAKSAPANYMGSVPVRITSRMQKSEFATEYDQEHDARRADMLNILYVAFTRAEQNLLVWGAKNQTKNDTIFSRTVGDIIVSGLEGQELAVETEEDTWEVGQPDDYEEKTEQKKYQAIRMCSFPGVSDIKQSEPARRFVRDVGSSDMPTDPTSKQQRYIEQGKLMHYVLSQIRTAADLPAVMKQMTDEGILQDKLQQQRVEQLIGRGLQTEPVREWFGEGTVLFRECDMITEKNGQTHIRRPDRVVQKGDRIMVVDFKFGNAREEHQQQVREYMDFMKQMCPDQQVEGYLWYVYKNNVVRL